MSRDAAARVHHDLGKAVVFASSWLPDDPSADALRGALRDDLLRTRRGPAGVHGIAEVWAGLRAELDPDTWDVRAVDDAVAAVVAGLGCLDAEPPRADDLAGLRAAAHVVHAACYAWVQRTRGG